MRFLPLFALGCAGLLAAISTNSSDVRLIAVLDGFVQRRFATPMPDALGMSRIMLPSSFGRHFQPTITSKRDFQPANPQEENAVNELEKQGLQVGFYLFGAAIARSEPESLSYRALKGPAAVTRGTERPAWYPALIAMSSAASMHAPASPDALPDWNAIYPLARKAMRSFDDGGKGFETTFGSWHIAARPVPASQQSCVSCHNNPAYGPPVRTAKLDQAIGGVLYAFRRANEPARQHPRASR